MTTTEIKQLIEQRLAQRSLKKQLTSFSNPVALIITPQQSTFSGLTDLFDQLDAFFVMYNQLRCYAVIKNKDNLQRDLQCVCVVDIPKYKLAKFVDKRALENDLKRAIQCDDIRINQLNTRHKIDAYFCKLIKQSEMNDCFFKF